MANYANLLAQIAANIYSNNNQEITGDILQLQLNAMVASLGAGYQFMGVAHPADTPSGYADLRAFWLAGEAGTYTNFGGLVVNENELAVISWDSAWHKSAATSYGDTPLSLTSGYYYYIAGAVVGQTFSQNLQPNASYKYGKIPCSPGDNFILNIAASGGAGLLLFCDANMVVLSKVASGSYTNEFVTAPTNAAYLFINNVSNGTSYKAGVFSVIDNRITKIETTPIVESGLADYAVSPRKTTFFTINLFDKNDPDVVTGKYITNASGSMSNNANYFITGYIPFSSGKLIASSYGRPCGGGGFWCLYDSSKNPISVGEQMGTSGGVATWASGAAYVRFSIAGSVSAPIQVENGENISSYAPYGSAYLKAAALLPSIAQGVGKLASMTSGNKITLFQNRVKSNKHLAFSAKVVSMGTLRLGHGYNQYASSWIDINATSIICHNYYASDGTRSVNHGLTISNTIQVVIEQGVENTCNVRLTSNGNTFTHTFPEWNGSVGDIFAESVGISLTDATLSWVADGITQDIWAFGDSYFSLSSDARWTSYLILNQHTKWLMDGQPGGDSNGSLTDLLYLSEIGRPKILFWAMGMNDPDTSSAVNASWNSCYEAVKSICKTYNIELILATIPTVSGEGGVVRIHKFKNAIVRASGYRYVDFDKAVGADESTGQWYAGMLSSDGVHPTTAGALTLYGQAVADFPELLTT